MIVDNLIKNAGWIVVLFLSAACTSVGEKPGQRIDYLLSVREVGKLQLSEMTITKVGRISDPSYDDATSLKEKAEAIVDKMKIGTRIGVYSYQTYLSAYIDLSEISPSDIVVDSAKSTVKIILPPVKIEWSGRDMGLEEIHYRVNGLRSNISPRERATLKNRMARQLKEEVEADKGLEYSIKESARLKAKSYFTELFHNWGLEPQISFRDE